MYIVKKRLASQGSVQLDWGKMHTNTKHTYTLTFKNNDQFKRLGKKDFTPRIETDSDKSRLQFFQFTMIYRTWELG